MTPIAAQLSEMLQLISDNCNSRGEKIVTEGESASALIQLWLLYLKKNKTTGVADSLLDGTISAVREAICCTTLGLVRPAINSLRLQLDLALAWIYFKDHSIEWERVQRSGEGFKLKTELIKYLGDNDERFGARFGLLKQVASRKLEDPYRVLSAHIHGQSEIVLPRISSPTDIVAPATAQDELLQLQTEVAEYINDLFMSMYADQWTSLPDALRTTLLSRFKTPEQRATFFA